MIQAFRAEDAVYRRYWARAYAGWPRFTAAAPERRASRLRRVGGGRHAARGSSRRTSTACTSAPAAARSSISTAVSTRSSAWAAATARRARPCRTTMAAANPAWQAAAGAGAGRRRRHRRRGDRVVRGAALRALRRPAQAGRRVLRRERARPSATRRARDALAGADALLVAGSSLMVYSGFRFVRQAHEAGLPIAIVNRGRTRGDDLAELKVEGDVGAVLTDALAARRVRGRGERDASALGDDTRTSAVGPGCSPARTVRASRHGGAYDVLLASPVDFDLRRGLRAHVRREVDRHLRARLGGETGDAFTAARDFRRVAVGELGLDAIGALDGDFLASASTLTSSPLAVCGLVGPAARSARRCTGGAGAWGRSGRRRRRAGDGD